jgi:hypothetical protein
LYSLLKFEVAKIFLHDVGHRHAQPRGEILDRHRLQLLRIFEQVGQTIRQSLNIPWRIKLNCQLLALRHLPEVEQIRANNRHSIRARQVSHSAASRRRRIWHHGNGGRLK